MNTQKFLINNLDKFPISEHISINIDGIIQIDNLKIQIENIIEVSLENNLKKLTEIHKGNILNLELSFNTVNGILKVKQSGLIALNIYGFLSEYLKIRNSKNNKFKIEESDLYCLTCESYKRKNKEMKCRLCKDSLIIRNF